MISCKKVTFSSDGLSRKLVFQYYLGGLENQQKSWFKVLRFNFKIIWKNSVFFCRKVKEETTKLSIVLELHCGLKMEKIVQWNMCILFTYILQVVCNLHNALKINKFWKLFFTSWAISDRACHSIQLFFKKHYFLDVARHVFAKGPDCPVLASS